MNSYNQLRSENMWQVMFTFVSNLLQRSIRYQSVYTTAYTQLESNISLFLAHSPLTPSLSLWCVEAIDLRHSQTQTTTAQGLLSLLTSAMQQQMVAASSTRSSSLDSSPSPTTRPRPSSKQSSNTRGACIRCTCGMSADCQRQDLQWWLVVRSLESNIGRRYLPVKSRNTGCAWRSTTEAAQAGRDCSSPVRLLFAVAATQEEQGPPADQRKADQHSVAEQRLATGLL